MKRAVPSLLVVFILPIAHQSRKKPSDDLAPGPTSCRTAPATSSFLDEPVPDVPRRSLKTRLAWAVVPGWSAEWQHQRATSIQISTTRSTA